jgi:uncharacterized phiE125 gp8 family phage protein
MPGFNAVGTSPVGAGSTSSSSSVSADLSVAYAVGGAISSDLAASYKVRAAVSADLAAQYAVRAQVAADLAVSYSITGHVDADLGAAYVVRSQVLADLAVSFAVQAQVMSSVSASLSVAYSVCASVSSDLACVFSVEPPVEYVRAPMGSVCRRGPAVYPDSLKRIGLVESAVSLDAARKAARADGDDLDEEILTAAEAYTEAAEHATGRAFVMQTWRSGFRAFAGEMVLPKPPLTSIAHVSYYDEAGIQRTLDPRDYFVDLDAEPAVLTPSPGRTWPATFDRANAVEVQYTCGYGPSEASVPKPVKQYVLARIQQQFSPVATAKEANFDRLLDPYWVYS